MKLQTDFLTVREFASKLRIHENTVRNGIKNGRIQALKVGSGKRSFYRISINECNRLAELDLGKLIDDMVAKKMEEK